MPSRSASDDAANVATRDQSFSTNITAEGPVTSMSSTTLPKTTSRFAKSSLTPSLTRTVNS